MQCHQIDTLSALCVINSDHWRTMNIFIHSYRAQQKDQLVAVDLICKKYTHPKHSFTYNSNPQSLFRIYHLLSCAFLSPCPSLFVCLSLVRLQSTLRCCSLQIHQSQLLKLHPLCCTTSTRQTHARHRSIQRPDIQHAYVCMCVPLLPRSPHPSSPLS